jgi:thymidylate synthase (FAD)
MAHCIIPEAEEILDKKFPVLDKGFVRLVDYLGGDSRIVQAARVSYGEGTKSIRKDKGLIDYLLRNDHTSPFEQVILTFHIKMPIVVARQWIRHRTARLNEISGRYSILPDDYYIPDRNNIAPQSTDNKQGRADTPADIHASEEIKSWFESEKIRTYETYNRMINSGIARELSRMVLPLNLYTEVYWQMDLHNLFHFLRLRLDPHAQLEIRRYAEVILKITQRVAPLAVESFLEHRINGVMISGSESAALRIFFNKHRKNLEDELKAQKIPEKKIHTLIQKFGLKNENQNIY